MTTYRVLFPLFLLLLPFFSTAQFFDGIPGLKPYQKRLEQLDSYLNVSPTRGKKILGELKTEARKNDNSTLMAVLNIYEGTYNYYIGKTDSAVIYFDRAIGQADLIRNSQLRSTAVIRKLLVLHGHNNSGPILTLMKDEYAVAASNHDTLNMIYSLNGQALCFDNLDSTKACIDTYMKAIRLAKNSGNEYEYGFLLNNLGLLKLRLKSPKEAAVDFRKGIHIAKKMKNLRLEVTLRENLGYYYQLVDSAELAIKEYEDTYDLARRHNYSHLAFNSLVNLGSMQRVLGNSGKSDSLMIVALDVSRKDKLLYAFSPIFLTMAQLESDAGNYDKVDALLDSAMLYSGFSSPRETREGVYMIRYEMYERQGRYAEALDYFRKLTAFRDSMNLNGHMQMITELQLKYDLERKEKQHAQEKREFDLRSIQMRQNLAIGSIVVILIIGGFIVYYFRQKHRREAEFSSALVNRLEEERGRIARDLHDGLGQSLVILKNKFNKFDGDPETARQIDNSFTETIEEVRTISRSLIPPELHRLGLRKAIFKMLKDVEESTSIMTTAELEALESTQLDPESAIRIYRIIQELTNNTIKHSEASSLKIEFERYGDKMYIIYQDNGKGIDEETSLSHNSVGMKSIRQRLRYLNGSIKIEKQNRGFKAVLRIKLKE